MGQLPPEDLSREIERLWTRLGTAPPEAAAPPPAPPQAGTELAWETVAMLKTQQRRREAALNETIDAKEESLKHWRARAEALQAETAALRARADGTEELLLAQQSLEDAARALEHERSVHEEERRILEAALEESKARIAAETARAREAEARWSRRETQNLVDLKDIQASAERRQQEAAAADLAVSALKASLAEAKNALEKTLAELLLERHERVRLDDERTRALKKTDEVEAHFADLQKLWEEERAQWRELWDRERSTWEAQRQELAQWEETLRREREAWHCELQEKEKSHLLFADGLAGKLRETTEAASLVERRMSQVENREERDRSVMTVRARRTRTAALALAGAAFLAAAFGAWRWATQWTYESEAAVPIAALNPTAFAFDGALLWVADWGGRLSAFDPADPRTVVREIAMPADGLLRPTALAFGAGRSWTLDAARARLLRAQAARPETALVAIPSPGPAPAALAFDGTSLWSYDAANRALYRHAADESMYQAYPIEEDVVPNALAWVDGRLWMHDTKSRRIIIYALVGDHFALKETHSAPDAQTLGFTVQTGKEGRRVWALVGPSAQRSQPMLLRLKLRRRLSFGIF